jgi:2-dehydro-3-deoxyphosphooctonate aldolase (KDO 8-P synthase)
LSTEAFEIADGVSVGGDAPLLVIAGPCVIETEEFILRMADRIGEVCARHGVGYVFKSSFDKANRSSSASERGPGMESGLEVLRAVRERVGVPVTTDVHEPYQCAPVAEVVDILQIPAFLARQTDLLMAAAATGKTVNVKKAQFMAPPDMRNVVRKLREGGAERVMLAERGTSFGYNTLVVDYRGLPQMRALGCPVVFDATHSVQSPGGLGDRSGGQREFVPTLARAAAAVGIDALFVEVHENPDEAPSDGPNMVTLEQFDVLLDEVLAVRAAAPS